VPLNCAFIPHEEVKRGQERSREKKRERGRNMHNTDIETGTDTHLVVDVGQNLVATKLLAHLVVQRVVKHLAKLFTRLNKRQQHKQAGDAHE